MKDHDDEPHDHDETENTSADGHPKTSSEEGSSRENDCIVNNKDDDDEEQQQQQHEEQQVLLPSEHGLYNNSKPTKRLYTIVGCLLCIFIAISITSIVLIGVVEPVWTTDEPTYVPIAEDEDDSILQNNNSDTGGGLLSPSQPPPPANLPSAIGGEGDGDGSGGDFGDGQAEEGSSSSVTGTAPNLEWNEVSVDVSGSQLQGTIDDGGFGHSIAMATANISGDDIGEDEMVTILIGGSPYSNQNTGHVQIHYLLPQDHDAIDDNNVMDMMMDVNQQSPFMTITLKGSNIGDEFGHDVALSKNGMVLAVSAIGDNSYNGYVQVYQYDNINKEWTKMGNALVGDVPTSDQQQQQHFGPQVVLNSDGTKLVISLSRFMMDMDDPSKSLSSTTTAIDGYVQVYEWIPNTTNSAAAATASQGNWIPMGNKITGVVKSKEECGASIDISDDGTIIAIGCPRYSNNVGRVMVYRYGTPTPSHLDNKEEVDEDIGWVQIGNDLVGDVEEDYFGSQLSMLGNGRLFAATAASGWSRCYEYKSDIAVTGTLTVTLQDEDWYPLGSDISIVSLRDGLFGGSISLSTFRHYEENDVDQNNSVVPVDGLVVVRGLYFLTDWALNPGFATVRWIPLRNNDDDDWTYVGQFLIGQDFGDRYGVSTAVTSNGDNQLVVAVGADSRHSGRVHVHSGTVAM